MSIGIPIKLLHEAESHVITVELKSGEVVHTLPLHSCGRAHADTAESRFTATQQPFPGPGDRSTHMHVILQMRMLLWRASG